MAPTPRSTPWSWTTLVPVLALVVLALTWGRDLGAVLVAVVAAVLAGAVLAAVHHAEVVAHRVGEPFGSLVLAVAVTVIEVALIVTLMVSGGPETRVAGPRHGVRRRDDHAATASSGCRLLVGAMRHGLTVFNAEGTGAALATVCDPGHAEPGAADVHHEPAGSRVLPAQLAFAAVASLRAVRRRSCSPRPCGTATSSCRCTSDGDVAAAEEHAAPPTGRAAAISLGLLLGGAGRRRRAGQGGVPAIEAGVAAAGFPHSFVGVVIALLVLLPGDSRRRPRGRARPDPDQPQPRLGSAMASIGLTIPVIAVASIWLDGPLLLGLGSTQMVLLALTVVVSVLTVVPGRATRLQGGVHLVLLAAFVFLAINP